MDTMVDLNVRAHLMRIVKAQDKDNQKCEALSIISPNSDDLDALCLLWRKSFDLALQGTAKGPFLVDATPEVLASNARKIADATVALFWGGLARLKD